VGVRLESMRPQMVHNDLNMRNILVDAADPERIAGVIDFGDCLRIAPIADVAIAAAAQVTGTDGAEQAILHLLRGYRQLEPLWPAELAVLNWLIAARLVMSTVIPIWHRATHPASAHFAHMDADTVGARFELARHVSRLSFV
jgi:hydroxylysine kinase